MKRERTVLTALGAMFLVELAIGIPALRNNLRDNAPTTSTPATTSAFRGTELAPQTPATAPAFTVAPRPAVSAGVADKATPATLAVARTQITSTTAPAASARPFATSQRARRALAFVAPPRHVAVIDDIPAAGAPASFTYVGRWERVRAIDDGRTAGTSTRSYRPDAEATLRFTGTEVRIFGVCGPHGGRALLAIDGRSAVPIEFYTTVKETHMLVYRSPRLPQGAHRVSISVAPGSDATKKRYVNIDGAEIDS